MGLGLLVDYALELIEQEKSIEEIVELLDKMRYEDSFAFYTINTLKYLRQGGRIGKVEGTIGNILHIKPVITVNDEGVYVTISKAFGMKRSLLSMKNILIEKFGSDPIDLYVHYGNDPETAKQLGEKLKSDLNIRNAYISQLTPVLGVHKGPDMFAYVARRA
jgi:DegV family protein with EDD domain